MDAWLSRAPRRGIAAGASCALLLLAVGSAANTVAVSAVSPLTIAVDSLADGDLGQGATTCTSAAAGGKCTLRAALELNDAGAGGSTVTLGSGQFQLTLGQLVANKSVTINGAGPAASVVLGSTGARVIQIGSGASPVTITALAIENGRATGGDSEGGGIANDGSLTLRSVTVQGNSGTIGGGIVDVGSLTLQSGVLIAKNHAFGIDGSRILGEGGGIAEFGTLTASGAVLSGNEAGGFVNGADNGFGGNLAVLRSSQSGRATIANTTIAQGAAGFGGGVFVDVGESATFTASTFAGNTANSGGADGGGLLNDCGAVSLTNDTFDGNRAPDGFGGAIDDTCSSDQLPAAPTTAKTPAVPGPPRMVVPAGVPAASTAAPAPAKPNTSLDFVTIADSAAASAANFAGGAGLVSAGDASNVTVHDTIIANGANNAAHNCATFESKIVSLGHNLEDRNDCGFTLAGDLTKTDPQLGALHDNGGPTQTMALVAGTAAVDAADPNCDVNTDQRGVSRPQGAHCDIGAFELAVAATPNPSPSGSPTALPQPPMTGTGPGRGGSGVPVGSLLVVLGLLVGAGGAATLLRRRRRTA